MPNESRGKGCRDAAFSVRRTLQSEALVVSGFGRVEDHG